MGPSRCGGIEKDTGGTTCEPLPFVHCKLSLCKQAIYSDTVPTTMGSLGETTNGHTKQSLDWTVYDNVIDGRLTTTEKTRHGINPATGKPNPEVPVATKDDVEEAMIAAKQASVKWATVPYAERSKAVLAYADALEIEHQAFSDLLVREQGKPV